jgi:hypothetical protein
MKVKISWHGTQQESFDLINAIGHNCSCDFGLMGARITTCSSHRMLIEDQRALDGLLFVRRMAARLQGEEFASLGTVRVDQ